MKKHGTPKGVRKHFRSIAINMALLKECENIFGACAINMALLKECETFSEHVLINMALLKECETFRSMCYKHGTPKGVESLLIDSHQPATLQLLFSLM
jgi:hypothetical protein